MDKLKFIKEFGHAVPTNERVKYYKAGSEAVIGEDIPEKYAKIALENGYAKMLINFEKGNYDKKVIEPTENKKVGKKKKREKKK